MARLGMCLSLFAAAILLIGVSAGLSADCGSNNTVEAGDNLTVHCSVNFSEVKGECNVEQYQWTAHDTPDNVICSNKMKKDMEKDEENKTNQIYTCGWDKNMQDFFLNIPRIKTVAEEIYNIAAQTNCGIVDATVTVKVRHSPTTGRIGEEQTDAGFTAWYLLPIMGALGVVGILTFLAFTQRGRTIIDYVRKKTTNRHLSNSVPRSEVEPLNV